MSSAKVLSMYRFELTCLAEAHGTTFECDIEEAEMIIVNVVQSASLVPNSYRYDDLDDLYSLILSKGKTVHLVEFGDSDAQPMTCSLFDLRAAVDDVLARSSQDLSRS